MPTIKSIISRYEKKNKKSNNKQMKNIKMQNQIKSNQTYQPQKH